MKATVATLKKYKSVFLAAIGILLAIGVVILCGLLASCSSQADTGSINAKDVVLAVMEDNESLLEEVQEGVEASEIAESSNEKPGDVSTEESVAQAQSAQPSGGTALSETNSSAPSTSTETKTQAPASSSQSAQQKKWVEDTQQVWVEDRAAWSESVPVYGTKEVSICNVCGAEISGNTAAHGKTHMLAGEGSGHHSEVRKVVTGYNTVNHPAEGHYETRVVGGHWE